MRVIFKSIVAASLSVSLIGCDMKWESTSDPDGDGYTIFQGDCDEGNPDVFPNQVETWYDGVDANCDGQDDFDADGDGFTSAEHGGDDCHDDVPDAFPGSTAEEVFYDCVDQDCDGNDGDFDDDGFLLAGYDESCEDWEAVNPGKQLGDCWDDDEVDYDVEYVGEEGDRPDANSVNPDAAETWYNGVDQDCDGNEFDQDGDGYVRDEECDDTDATIFPDPSADDPWYDCLDQNCDGNDGDQDEDGYLAITYVDGDGVVQDYTVTCPGWEDINPGIVEGDCWDDPDSLELPYYPSINGFPNLNAADVNPGAAETWYDGVDQDCAGEDADFDADGDRWDSDTYPNRDGELGRDCQEGDPNANPGASELCATAYDDDCDGEINEPGAPDGEPYYEDADGDTYGDILSTRRLQCGPDSASDYTTLDNTDCDDSNSAINPGATELPADEVDQDCDGDELCYVDSDGDDYGSSSTTTRSGSTDCDAANLGYADDSDDCDDTDANDYPGANETVANGDDEDCDGFDDCYQDSDGDGQGSSTVVTATSLDCDQASSGFADDDDDCDDTDNSIYDGAPEVVADGVDQDCDSADDCYQDSDRDGYGSSTVVTGTNLDCDRPSARLANDDQDCDDTNGDINPGEDEVCNSGVDDDCDGLADDADSDVDLSTGSTFYDDGDGDGFGDPSDTTDACLQPSGYVADDTDCDDTDAAINSAATETCDGDDNDCDGLVDDDDSNVSGTTTYYADADGDGYGDPSSTGDFCVQPSGYETDNTDCDDTNDITGARTNPGEAAADNSSGNLCLKDRDQDGYGDDNPSRSGVDAGTDCDDSASGGASIYPGASDAWYDGVDADCAGDSDYDADGDGEDSDAYSGVDCDDTDGAVNTSATETWYDGVDQDCDGASDYDADGDGDDSDAYSGDDCDDDDNTISSLATENWYDGVDQDCDGLSDYDADLDGYDSDAHSGDDCDDSNPDANPGITEVWYNGVDNDCSGADSDYDADGDGEDSIDHSGTDCDDTFEYANSAGDELDSNTTCFDGYDNDCDGVYENGCFDDGTNDGQELVISEIYYNDATGNTWFEIANESGGEINLNGMVFTLYDYDAGAAVVAVTISTDEVLNDGDRYVLCKNAARPHLVGNCDYDWTTNLWDLTDDDDLSIIIDQPDGISDVRIDEVNFLVSPLSGWPELPSTNTQHSIELCVSPLDTTDNDDGANWAEVDTTGTTYRYYSGSGDNFYGTPGAVNSCN